MCYMEIRMRHNFCVSFTTYDQRWVKIKNSVVKIICMSLVEQHRANVGPTLMVGVVNVGELTLTQHYIFNSLSTVIGPTLVLQLRTNGGFRVVGPKMARHMLVYCNRVIYLYIRVTLIMQNTYFL